MPCPLIPPQAAATANATASAEPRATRPMRTCLLADIVRTDHQLRIVRGDSQLAEAVRGGHPGPQDADPGADPAHLADAQPGTGVLPRRPGGVRGPDRT